MVHTTAFTFLTSEYNQYIVITDKVRQVVRECGVRDGMVTVLSKHTTAGIMLWTDEMFGTKKPIIAMLHLDPLPGDPRYGHGGGTVSTVVEHAKRDLDALQEGGVDGIIVSNEFSLPYQRHMDYVTPATMRAVS